MPDSRRAFLATLGTGVATGFGGCFSRPQSTGETDSTTRTDPSPTTIARTGANENTTDTTESPRLRVGDVAAVEGGRVLLQDVAIRRFVRRIYNHPHAHVVSDPSKKYLTVLFREFDLGRPPVTARVRLDGETLDSTYDDLYTGYRYNPSLIRLGFAVPEDRTAREAVVVFTDESGTQLASWELGQAVLDRFARPAEFSLESFEISDRMGSEEEMVATITVENTGRSDGKFAATLGPGDLSHPPLVEFPVGAGERAVHREPVSTSIESGAVTVELDWGRATVTRTVRVGQ